MKSSTRKFLKDLNIISNSLLIEKTKAILTKDSWELENAKERRSAFKQNALDITPPPSLKHILRLKRVFVFGLPLQLKLTDRYEMGF